MATPHTHGGTDAPECTTCVPQSISTSHKVMLDELIKAGILQEEYSIPDGMAGLSKMTFSTLGVAQAMAKILGGPVKQRYTTAWEETWDTLYRES